MLRTKTAKPATDDLEAIRSHLADNYRQVRGTTRQLCEPLQIEDYQLQSMPDASPPKWHLAHTTWFFETFILIPHLSGYSPSRSEFQYLFNSYYNSVGEQWARPQRGLLSRPTVAEVYSYRDETDARLLDLIQSASWERLNQIQSLIHLGLNHEQQHQELLLTDLKHGFSLNPIRPRYSEASVETVSETLPLTWIPFEGGMHSIGFAGRGFSFDNESPRHEVLLRPFRFANRAVTCGEYRHFVEDGGYRDPRLWLSDGWATVNREGWDSPLYWERRDDEWWHFTLHGMRPVHESEPVTHVSYYEADAFATWANRRLPTEYEWEIAALNVPIRGTFLQSGRLHPAVASGVGLTQMFGDGWQWTASPYAAYPGYRPQIGALGEYNGKFMCNQFVLRGGSCVTPTSLIRPTYRNFFPPGARWQFTSIRLASED